MPDTPPLPGPRSNAELLDLTAAYALDAVDSGERHAIGAALAGAAPSVRQEFDEQVRDYREALAEYARTGAAPAPAHLRERILRAIADEGPADPDPGDRSPGGQDRPAPASLDSARRRRRLNQWLAGVAAAAVLFAGGVAIGHRIGGSPAAPTAAQVFAAQDVRTSAVDVAGGTATVMYSRNANAAVLLMNNVARPQPDTVYQLWLIGPDHAPTSVGMMDRAQVVPSTRAFVDGIDAATALGISVEPPGGSAQPTTIMANISLG